jgi:homoserine dehydrogenase
MPKTTPAQKISQVKLFGKEFVEVVLIGDSFDDASKEAFAFCNKHKLTFVHPFDDEKVIEGQGTVAKEILDDAEINVVVELINDSHEAYHIVKEALEKGKHVVTANKKLVAERLDELIELAKTNNVSLLYEGAVAGSIPIIRNLEEYYNNDSLSSLEGIVNGTTNYILTQSDQGISYHRTLAFFLLYSTR